MLRESMIPVLVETSPGSNVLFGTGNVFYDLGLPDAYERTTKMRLTAALKRILKASKLTRKKAAALLGITLTDLSALQDFKIDEFPVERLMQFASELGYNVVIELQPKEGSVLGASVVVVSAP
jgi:predicted XRE-type DNA-binding protein